MNFRIFLIFIFSCYADIAVSKSPFIILENLYKSVDEHFPLIIRAINDVQEKQALELEREGFQDSKIKGKYNSRGDGFYTGDYLDVSVERNLGFLNSKIYGGWRQSRGSFPEYEGKMETLGQGESNIGFSFSLLKNSFIDKNRALLQKAKNNVDLSQNELEQLRFSIRREAEIQFWNLYYSREILIVTETMLKLAEDRISGIKRRIKNGDLAKLSLIESQKIILNRKSDLLATRQNFINAALDFSLFYRDSKGLPLILKRSELESEELKVTNLQYSVLDKALSSLENNLILRKLDIKKKNSQIDLRIGKNSLRPTLDVSFEQSKDQGSGSETLRGDENRVLLNLEIPIERMTGKGQVSAAKNKIRKIELERDFKKLQIRNKIINSFNTANNLKNVLKNLGQAVDFTEQLEKAERRRFKTGASNIFILNLREQDTANAKIKYFGTKLKHKIMLAKFSELSQLEETPR